ncbi:hypothetical protein N0V95_005920 [Ascochyta clinopodiicola]|nr:hypothetical protein N0V95_005920 [Ascochyta clinopodiicola]
MSPCVHIPPIDDVGILHRSFDTVSQRADTLHAENAALKSQIRTLGRRISSLEAENTQLQSTVTGVLQHLPASNAYTTEGENAIYLPVVLESLAIMQDHFRRHGTLKQCSTPGCGRYAFDQACFREGHMAWCRTHNRIITRTYTSCSVRPEARGDCLPVFWEYSSSWGDIVALAFRDGKIGRKGVPNFALDRLLFPENDPILQHGSQSIPLSNSRYPHSNWS